MQSFPSPPRVTIASPAAYVFTRFVLLRLLGLVYAIAFLILIQQQGALLGHDGILPADRFVARVAASFDSRADAAAGLPTLFWLDASDATRQAAAWTGFALALAVLLGTTNALVQFALWALYLSFVQIGQLFYGYGWEGIPTGLFARAGEHSSRRRSVLYCRSPQDIAITRRLREVGELMGVRVLDHVVIGHGRYVSFTDEGL